MKRSTSLLLAVGLALVGLLAGILGTLLWSDQAAPSPQFVRRVELGAPSADSSSADSSSAQPPTTGAPDSSLPAVAGRVPRGASDPDERGQLNGLFRDVAERVRPGVVYVKVESGGRRAPDDGNHNFDDDLRRRFFGPRRSVGSGVVISPDGYVVTNNHVVNDARTIEVTLTNKRRFDAEVVGTDPSTDLAVVKLEGASGLPALALGNSDRVEVGDWVLAVGNPFRLTSTVTAGIVSALGRQVDIIKDDFGIESFIQTDAAINPGNSGGALVNMEGELVGINTAIASEGGSYEGYGFAVPVNLVERVARDLIERGEVERGFLGVRIGDVNAPMARRLDLDHVGGAYISEVKSGGAADQAGLERGDVILAIGDRAVEAANELQSVVARRRPGDTVRVKVSRAGKARTFAVRLLSRDAPAYRGWVPSFHSGSASDPPSRDGGGGNEDQDGTHGESPEPPQVFEIKGWGLGLQALTDDQQEAFGRKRGVYLAYVDGGAAADRAGLPRDAVLTAIDGSAIASVEDALTALKHAAAEHRPALLRVRKRNGTSAFFEVEPPR